MPVPCADLFSISAQSALRTWAPAAAQPHPDARHLCGPVLHQRAVIANGGGQAIERAALALTVLDHLSVSDVPVGIGSAGKPYEPSGHEYSLEGFSVEAATPRLEDGALLLRRTLEDAAPNELTVVCISSLRDFADALADYPDLVLRKVKQLSVMGGLRRDEGAPGGWAADDAVNNSFDLDAARELYTFCFERGLPLVLTSRHAVPMLAMQLAHSFALSSDCPVRANIQKRRTALSPVLRSRPLTHALSPMPGSSRR